MQVSTEVNNMFFTLNFNIHINHQHKKQGNYDLVYFPSIQASILSRNFQ